MNKVKCQNMFRIVNLTRRLHTCQKNFGAAKYGDGEHDEHGQYAHGSYTGNPNHPRFHTSDNNFYTILNVKPGASVADIKKSYLEKSKELHPVSHTHLTLPTIYSV